MGGGRRTARRNDSRDRAPRMGELRDHGRRVSRRGATPRGRRCGLRASLEAPAGRGVSGVGGWAKRAARPRGRRRSAGCLLLPHERSVHGGCGGPAGDVDAAHLGLVIEVVARHRRVVGRRRDQVEPERGPGRRRGRPAADVMRHGEVVRLVADCLQRAPSWSRTTTRPHSRSLPPWRKNAP